MNADIFRIRCLFTKTWSGRPMTQDDNLANVPAALDEEFQHDMISEELPHGLAAILARELEPKEKVVWVGQPDEVAFMRRSIGSFLVGIPFFAFAVFWTRGAVSSGMARAADGNAGFPWFFLLWGAMFVAVGAGMLLSPLWSWWLARHTLYAVTDRRALLIEAPGRRRIQAYSGERLLNSVRVEDKYGRGDLILERLAVAGRRGSTRIKEVGFFGLDNVKHVEQLVRATVDRDRRPWPDGRLPEFLRKG
jgi:hypothetical protein